MRSFFRKSCFLILVSLWSFYYTIVYLLKMNYLYYQFWTKESLSFSEMVACKCSIKKLRIKFYQSSLAALLKKRLRCISVNLAKFFEKHILQNTCEWLDFASLLLFVKFSSEELDLKSFIRAREPAWNEWKNENLGFTWNKVQTSN